MRIIDFFGHIYQGIHGVCAVKFGVEHVAFSLFVFLLIVHIIMLPLFFLARREKKMRIALAPQVRDIHARSSVLKDGLLSDGATEFSDAVLDLEMHESREVSRLYLDHHVLRGATIAARIFYGVIALIFLFVIYRFPEYLPKAEYIYRNVDVVLVSMQDNDEVSALLPDDYFEKEEPERIRQLYEMPSEKWSSLSKLSYDAFQLDSFSKARENVNRIVGMGSSESLGVSVLYSMRGGTLLSWALCIFLILLYILLYALRIRWKNILAPMRLRSKIFEDKLQYNAFLFSVAQVCIFAFFIALFLNKPNALLLGATYLSVFRLVMWRLFLR